MDANKDLNRIFCGNSMMAQTMRAFAWEKTGLGVVSSWPEELIVSLRIILSSAYPMFVWWGSRMHMFYNDAYMPVLGSKHPRSLGSPGKQMWLEIWEEIGPLLKGVISTGETAFKEKHLLYTERNCKKEETYYTYSYSPILLSDGSVGGIFCACHEDTPQVLSERRLRTISGIASVRTDVSVEASREDIMRVLAGNPSDLPFVFLYEAGEQGLCLRDYSKHAFRESPEGQACQQELRALLESMPVGAELHVLPVPPRLAELLDRPGHGMLPEKLVALPLHQGNQQQSRSYLLVGISAVLPFDEDYRKFLHLLASQVHATMDSVRAFERERLLARKLLEVDKAKTDFFSNVSHEFRTPLTLILGPLELLLRRADSFSEEDARSLQHMHLNGMKLLKQVNTLLNFSSLESGRHNAVFRPVELSKLTGQLAGAFQPVMQRAGIDYLVTCEPLSQPFYVDTAMWEMVVFNLLSNAFKFTFSGSVKLELREQDTHAVLSVSDTGIGIPEGELPRVFERFHRIEQNVGRSMEGSGIGLSLVAGLVKLHGGKVEVSSRVSRGTTFRVFIPRGSDHLQQDRVQDRPPGKASGHGLRSAFLSEAESYLGPSLGFARSPDAEAGAGQGERLTILLVDDNPYMLDYLTRILQQEYYLRTARNGQEALQVLTRHPVPDLILSDVMMPVMDGVSLLQELRSSPAYVSIPVVLLSARAADSDKFQGLDMGADDYLVKPFSAAELLTRARSNIRNARLRSSWKEKEQRLLLETAQRMELLESILDSINEAFYHLTPELEFSYVNRKALELAGKGIAEHLGRKVPEVYSCMEGSELYGMVRQVAETQQPAAFEYYHPDLKLWFDCKVNLTGSGITLYLDDITERKLRQQAHLETEKRFREMANIAPVLIWMAGTDMMCDFFNLSWLEFRGRTAEQESGMGWFSGVHPEDQDHCMETYLSSFQARLPFEMEYRLQHKSGEYRWLLDKAVPRLTEEGQFIGYIGACTDITEQKRAEAILSNYNQELVETVNQRTEELSKTNQQLQSLAFYLQDLRENERKLIAREIHDELGQALTAFKIEISLLYDSIAGTRSRNREEMLDNLASMEEALQKSFQSMRKIITSLRPSLSDELELVHVIRQLAADLEKRVGVPIRFRSDVEKLELEPNAAIEVYRIVQESFTNIIKHARASYAYVRITRDEEGVRIRVTDNGIGFDLNNLPSTGSFGILGIRERAQRIGARLVLASKPGQGTSVELQLQGSADTTYLPA